MDSGTSVLSMESQAVTTRNSRPRRLHTCGVSILTIAHKVYTKAEEYPGPIGSLTKKLATIASPTLCSLQHQMLAVLSFTDDRILAMENVVETLLPPSAYVFNKIDTLVHISETLPAKFDYMVDEFLVIAPKLPFLNWASTHLISVSEILISTITDCGTDVVKEKEIVIDINCDVRTNKLASEERFQCPTRTTPHAENEMEIIVKPNSIDQNSPPICDTQQPETKSAAMDKSCTKVGDDIENMKCTYKEEVLEEGKKENVEKKGECDKETRKAMVSESEACKGAETDANEHDGGVVEKENVEKKDESDMEETRKAMVSESEACKGAETDANEHDGGVVEKENVEKKDESDMEETQKAMVSESEACQGAETDANEHDGRAVEEENVEKKGECDKEETQRAMVSEGEAGKGAETDANEHDGGVVEKENVEKKDECDKEETQKAMVSESEEFKGAETGAIGSNGGVMKEDPSAMKPEIGVVEAHKGAEESLKEHASEGMVKPDSILDLFEAGWHR